MLLSSFFTRSMAFTHMPKVQLPFALFSETFLTIRQNSLYVTVCIIARPSYRGYFIHSLSTLHPRESVIENVNKMMHCGDSSYVGAMYHCPDCNEWKFVPFRCHSRFCPTCGNMYSIDRTTSMSFKIINAQHRHCVFTIDSELRHFFLENRKLLGLLFDAVQSVIFRAFYKDNKSECFTPGFILVLHTFGRDLKWNPHIHCLVSEGGIGNSGLWRSKKHFNYTFLRNAFRTALLDLMEKELCVSFKKVKARCYQEHKHGFYVYAKPNKCNPKIVTKYIGRYLGRPVIATSRIDHYDGETVTFHYNRHEDNRLITESVPVMQFIQRLIQHIPEKHFKQIRYYGLYAGNHKNDSKLNLAIAKEKRKIFLSFNRWRDCILHSFGYDPLKCPCCGETMTFLDLYYNHQHISLNEMYERTMHRFHAHSSA